MPKISQFLLILSIIAAWLSCSGITNPRVTSNEKDSSAPISLTANEKDSIIIGAQRTESYLPLLKGKKVAVIANQTSVVNGQHLVDLLIAQKVDVMRVFAPEHGFRGEAGPGDKVASGIDNKTGLPVVSLYGSKRRPSKEDLEQIDVVVFDIQDVGARFYTYISTLHYMMEECALYGITVIVLDRPNPNGFYVDGPVLDSAFSSFVGVAPIPIVHGLTVGEYAKMVLGEGWLKEGRRCQLQVVTMMNYSHVKEYALPINPSPNLTSMDAILLYPTLCLFEGTVISVGRGTPYPFTCLGFPGYTEGKMQLTPVEIPGVIKDPPFEGVMCNAKNLKPEVARIKKERRLMLEWVLEMYKAYPEKEKFFNPFFGKLAGNDLLRKQIEQGLSAEEIRASWQPSLSNYKLKRKKYLLYPD
ncbi:MAG: exo-beta-N-acetylmuramidase NamZ domain-containing protein [Bacteroidota bacterium]